MTNTNTCKKNRNIWTLKPSQKRSRIFFRNLKFVVGHGYQQVSISHFFLPGFSIDLPYSMVSSWILIKRLCNVKSAFRKIAHWHLSFLNFRLELNKVCLYFSFSRIKIQSFRLVYTLCKMNAKLMQNHILHVNLFCKHFPCKQIDR